MRNCSAGILFAGFFLLIVPGFASKLGFFSDHQDVGVVRDAGKVKYNRQLNTYTVTGGGANIWGSQDAFQYVYEQVSGDLSLMSKLEWVSKGTEAHRKAGLMIRQTLAPDSEFADVMVHGNGVVSLQYRETAGATVAEVHSKVYAPGVVRIERRGDEITIGAGNSEDDLKTTGPLTLHFQDPVYLGFAVCAHNVNLSETAIFSSPRISTGGPI